MLTTYTTRSGSSLSRSYMGDSGDSYASSLLSQCSGGGGSGPYDGDEPSACMVATSAANTNMRRLHGGFPQSTGQYKREWVWAWRLKAQRLSFASTSLSP